MGEDTPVDKGHIVTLRERMMSDGKAAAAELDAEAKARDEYAAAVADMRERRDWRGLRRLREQEQQRRNSK